jgi:hypothetical protein
MAETGKVVVDKLKVVIVTGLGEIPEVGGILAGLVELLWPEWEKKEQDPWELIRERTEQLIQACFTMVKPARGWADLQARLTVICTAMST